MAKILIVDDSQTLRADVRRCLEGAGHQVVEACDGLDGLTQAAADRSLNIIITDLNMPQLDGLSMVQKIRTTTEHNKTPIFLLTTESSSDLRVKAKEVGVSLWMVKPFKNELMIKAVNAVLAKVAA